MRESPADLALVATFAFTIAGALGTPSDAATGSAGTTAVSPVDRACASDRLPRDILDGPVAAPKKPLRTIEVAAPAARLRLAVADTERDREFGLMCVTHMRPQHGMIFVFASENEWEFWMKNTLVPLDMIWLTSSGEVTAVAANVPAVTGSTAEAVLPRRRGTGIYVIELGANEAAADGLVIGSHLTVPALHAAL